MAADRTGSWIWAWDRLLFVGQRVPSMLAHIGQIHRVDPVRGLAHAAQVPAAEPSAVRGPASSGRDGMIARRLPHATTGPPEPSRL
jgi:hypothetical protein